MNRITPFAMTAAVLLPALFLLVGVRPASAQIELVPEEPTTIRILFLGNQAVGGDLSKMVVKIAESAIPGVLVETSSAAPPGFDLRRNLREARTSGTQLNSKVQTADDKWDVIVLQEDHKKLTYSTSAAARREELSIGPQLSSIARETDATVLFMMTWGFPDGDPKNLKWYPEYGALQKTLVKVYQEMAGSAAPAYVAPVGLAYQNIYQSMWDKQNNPLKKGSPFLELYGPDAQNPSKSGAYLAACVLVASFSGLPVTNAGWVPDGVDKNYAAYLRQIADRTVFGEIHRPRSDSWRNSR